MGSSPKTGSSPRTGSSPFDLTAEISDVITDILTHLLPWIGHPVHIQWVDTAPRKMEGRLLQIKVSLEAGEPPKGFSIWGGYVTLKMGGIPTGPSYYRALALNGQTAGSMTVEPLGPHAPVKVTRVKKGKTR